MNEKQGVIYTRVSSQKQVTQGSGLESQHAACLAYAKENNITIMDSFQDAAFSGKTADRPGLEALLQFLKKQRVEINKLISAEPLINEGVINVKRKISRISKRFRNYGK